MSKNQKVVIDTNVWISGLIFGGKPEIIIKLFIDGKIDVIISEEILTELRRIISTKFPLFKPKLGLLEASIREDSVLVHLGNNTITVSRDIDDNKIIETAVMGKADFVVTGDDDLLVLKIYENIRIIKPKVFLTIFNKY
jgi:putative PIN family toxin of toxin-antitoxin system